MYEDLQKLADLKLGKAIETISQEIGDLHRAKVSEFNRRGLLRSGLMVKAIIDLQIERCERICRAIETIWKDLIVRREGKLSQEAVRFIVEKVSKQTENVANNVPDEVVRVMGNADSARQELSRRADRVLANIRRDLTILVKESELFPMEQRLRNNETIHEWDLFICHASEDKEDFVRPLARALSEKGAKVWYDEFTLRIGDSLRRSIDKGLAKSRYGVVVLSPSFFAKEWPQKELDGLVAREIEGKKVILPIWHNVTSDDVCNYSPTLADRLAASSGEGSDVVVGKILDAIG